MGRVAPGGRDDLADVPRCFDRFGKRCDFGVKPPHAHAEDGNSTEFATPPYLIPQRPGESDQAQ